MRDLTVIVQAENSELLAQIHDGLIEARKEIMAKTGLRSLSFLRGDLSFCVQTLQQKREYPVLVILQQNTYSQANGLSAVKDAGADDVYSYASSIASEVVHRIKICVYSYLHNKSA